MRRRLIGTAAAVFLLAAAPASAARLPRSGVLVPGRSLGGVRLGETPAAVRRAIGSLYGVCRGCARRTWYFTYRRFDDHGLAVEFTDGRVSALYTLWQPFSWHDTYGLALGAPETAVRLRAGPTHPVSCSGYKAYIADSSRARTAYFVYGGRLWGFGLFRHGARPCR
jgi:hypothetical protein